MEHDHPPYGRRRTARRSMARDELRASDAERHIVADELSHHYSEGRLDDQEIKERLERCMAARTHADLAGLLDDLPEVAEPVAVGTDLPPDPARRRRRWPMALLAVLVVLSALSTLHHAPWLLWVLVAAVVVLGRRRHRCHRLPPSP
ncbi:MAG: DUF1707 SHOCT-like domain-containing protein [Acidimicrobiales bacterium]